MPPRLYLFSASRPLVIISSKSAASQSPAYQCVRCITANEKLLPKNEQPEVKGPNQDQLPHVSEEAGAMADITGEGGPQIDQGTPVQEVGLFSYRLRVGENSLECC